MTGTGKRLKKYSHGEATWYLTRKQALKKLQINLRDFRRLCVMKGIYPREPIKRARAQKGSTEIKTLYYKKDIQFLLHEPMIWKMWDNKALHKKIQKAVGKGDRVGAKRLTERRSKYQLDNIVKERYPTFSDALGDMDDALTLCSLFAIMPAVFRVSTEIVSDCRRLTVEFMHYVIEARALRKAFISIRGFYFQADIQGHTVTWVMPHQFVYTRPQDVDLKVMTIFCEFYTTFLGFVVFRLYQTLNLHYPPRLALTGTNEDADTTEDKATTSNHKLNGGKKTVRARDSKRPTAASLSVDELLEERVTALNCPLRQATTTAASHDAVDDDEEERQMALMSMASGDQLQQLQQQRELVRRTCALFDNMRFFIGREVPREPCVLLIRALGGVCSWDATCAPGATYAETDQTITHQVVDRKMTAAKYTSRYYVQPQWLFDSLNAGQLRPVQLYFPGVELPPHLSPFKQEQVEWGEYVPPDKLKLLNELSGECGESVTNPTCATSDGEDATDCDDERDEDQVMSSDSGQQVDSGRDNETNDDEQDTDDGAAGDDIMCDERDSGVDDGAGKMSVSRGTVEVPNTARLAQQASREEFWLRAHMVKKKDRYKFNRLVQRKKRFENEARQLSARKKIIDSRNATPIKKKKKCTVSTD